MTGRKSPSQTVPFLTGNKGSNIWHKDQIGSVITLSNSLTRDVKVVIKLNPTTCVTEANFSSHFANEGNINKWESLVRQGQT